MNFAKYFEPGWTIYRKTVTQDGAGGIVETYATHAAVLGRMRPLSGNYRNQLMISADKGFYSADHRFYCSPVDILEGDQLKKGSDTYDVKHVANMMTFDKFYHVDCELTR